MSTLYCSLGSVFIMLLSLKGQWHEIFCFGFFSRIIFPQALENNTRVVSRYLFASQSAPPVSTTLVANLPPVSTTSAEKLLLVSTTQSANLSPVSTTPAAYFANSSTGVGTSGKQWEQYQTANNLKWTWRKKFIYMLTLISKGVQKK